MKTVKNSSILSLLLLLGILTLVNAIGIRSFLRLDLTSSQMYSLSSTSKKIVSSIPDKVIVRAYFSPDLPSPYNTAYRYLRDMLEDYRAFSKGHLEYQFIDPGSAEKLEQEAQSFQIPPQQFQTVENDKIEVKRGYMGVVFLYGDKREVMPVVQGIDNLEYEITSLINRLTSARLPRLGITSTGSAENEVSTQQLYEALARNYDLQMADLYNPIPKDYTGLLVIAPREPFTDWQLFNLDQYIMNGGKVAVLANSYEGSMQSDQYTIFRELNLNKLLNQYGIGLGADVVMDNFCNVVTVPYQQGFFVMNQQIRVPYFPILETFNKGNMITRTMEQLPIFFASSVDTTLAAAKGYTIEGLMYTSEVSSREKGPSFRINVMRQWTRADFPERSIPVAAVVQGAFTSYFASGAPARTRENPDGTVVPDETSYTGTVKTRCDEPNRLLVVGDGNLALDDYSYPNGLNFVLNTADWLAQSEDLSSIRSKTLTIKPLKNVSDFTRKAVKWFNQVGPVIMIIVMGVVLWQVRRIRKKRLMAP